MNNTDAAKAERLSEKRGRMLPILAILFLTQQATYFTRIGGGDRTVDHVGDAAWLVLSVVIIAALLTGGGWIYSRKVRELANDEATRANRDQAFRVGFVATMITCIVLYVIALYEPMSGREAIHLTVTIGIACTLSWFGVLERRASRGG